MTNQCPLEDATFIATKFEAGTAITVDDPVPMVINQIVITPSDFTGDISSYCGVSLNYKRRSKYDTHLGSQVILSPEEEARLVEWLHRHEADFIIDTGEFTSKSPEDATIQGRCEHCGVYFDKESEWEVTFHNEDDYDRHFCSTECFEEYTIPR